MVKLSERQRRFADEYIICGNIEQSAMKAGYSKNYARARSHELLSNVGVKAYIDKRLDEIRSEKVADQQEIMEFLTSVIRGEVTEPVPLFDSGGGQVIVDIKPSVQTRKGAAVDLGKRYAMWTDKAEVTQRIIEVEVGEYDGED